MPATADRVTPVAKKRSEPKGQARRYGTLVRVSDEFAEAIKQASGFEGLSVAEFATKHLLPVVEKRYRDAVTREARRLAGGD